MRPKIICHMVSSVDGRLLAGRWTPPASGIAADLVRRVYEETGAQLGGDGWLVGRKTMAEMVDTTPRPLPPAAVLPRCTHLGERHGRSVAIAIDPHGKVYHERDEVGGDHLVAVLGERVSDGYLAELQRVGVSYLFAGADGTDLSTAMAVLGDAFGIETILLEGGGGINGAFLKAGLIDELSLLIYPGIDGLAGIPSIFEYPGAEDERPAAGLALRHLASETLEGGMVWLRYRFEPVPTTP
jgi:5-amino-6-(5-phosphoribosylamino)uracil reductase